MSTTSILQRAWNPIQEALAGWFSRTAPREEAPPARPAEEMYQLDRILQIYVKRQGGAEVLRLMTEKVGPGSLLFKGPGGLQSGQALEVQLLLRSDLFLTLSGTVKWVQSSGTGCSGELELTTPPEYAEAISSFLRQRGRLVSGAELSNKHTIAQPRQRAHALSAAPCRCPECGQIIKNQGQRRLNDTVRRPTRYRL